MGKGTDVIPALIAPFFSATPNDKGKVDVKVQNTLHDEMSPNPHMKWRSRYDHKGKLLSAVRGYCVEEVQTAARFVKDQFMGKRALERHISFLAQSKARHGKKGQGKAG